MKRDAANRDGLKSLKLEGHFIVADWQQGRRIESGFVGDDRSRDASVAVLDGDSHARQRAASLVGRASGDGARWFPVPKRRYAISDEQRQQDKLTHAGVSSIRLLKNVA
jgi:hypothetical protein